MQDEAAPKFGEVEIATHLYVYIWDCCWYCCCMLLLLGDNNTKKIEKIGLESEIEMFGRELTTERTLTMGTKSARKKKTQIISYNKRMGKLHTHHFQRSNRTTTHSIIIIFQLNWFSFAAVAWIGKIQQTHLYDAHLRVLQIGLANKKSTLKIVMYLFFYIYLYIFFADYFCRVCSNTAVHRDLLCVVYLFLFAFYTCFCRKFVASVRLFALFFFFLLPSLALTLLFSLSLFHQTDDASIWQS